MPSKHYFRCRVCKCHLTFVTEHAVPVSPGRTHMEAMANGAEDAYPKSPGDKDCLGRISYCSGYDLADKCDCRPQHVGTVALVCAPAPKVNQNWLSFATRVDAAWQKFVSSGYNVALRGANNHREHTAHGDVKNHLQSAGGSVKINGGTYVVSNSVTATVSLHRTIPLSHQVGQIKSFIYHL